MDLFFAVEDDVEVFGLGNGAFRHGLDIEPSAQDRQLSGSPGLIATLEVLLVLVGDLDEGGHGRREVLDEDVLAEGRIPIMHLQLCAVVDGLDLLPELSLREVDEPEARLHLVELARGEVVEHES